MSNMRRAYTSLPYIEYPVAVGNYSTVGRKPIEQIIIHSTVSSYQSAITWFNNVKAKVSAHYIISNKGELAAMLEEYNVAYAAGNLEVNNKSISLEHEWYQGMVISDKLYSTSAKLVADICKFYNLGVNRGVIKGHKEFVATGCPNQIDVDRIVREANTILNPAPVESIPLLKQKIADLQQTEIRLKAEMGTLQKQTSALLADKDKVCQLKIEDFKIKIINSINSYV